MFYICRIPIPNENEEFILYDRKAFKPDDFNVEGVKEITLDEVKSDYNLLPILSLNDFVLGTLNTKMRTHYRILRECGIETFKAFEYEKGLVENKKSKLSRSQRDLVLALYTDMVTCVTEPEENITE